MYKMSGKSMEKKEKSSRKNNRITAKDIALIGMMIAVIEVSKFALAQVPNVELTTFWIIMFTLYLGKRIFYVIPAFILIESVVYGFQLWVIMYLYAWPMLAVAALLMRKRNTYLGCTILSGVFGLLFGLLCSVPYVFTGAYEGGLMNGFGVAFSWWVAGIPFDLIHGISNIAIMLVLYYPIRKAMQMASEIVEKE